MDGEDGGNGLIYSLALEVAPISCPAKTVANTSGFGLNVQANFTAGLGGVGLGLVIALGG